MTFPEIITLLSAASPVCATPPRIVTSVVAVSAPAVVGTDLTLSELADMAKQSGAHSWHDPLGFYFGRFSYSFQITAPAGQTDCVGSVRVSVQMRLTNRHIEIGRELKTDSCAFSKVLAHYERHAAYDEMILYSYVDKVRSALVTALPPAVRQGIRAADVVRGGLDTLTQSTIEQALVDLTSAREGSGEHVDTPEEIKRLQAQCVVSIEKGAT